MHNHEYKGNQYAFSPMVEDVKNDEVSLRDIILTSRRWFRYLLSKWKIIFLASFIGAVLGFTYSVFQNPVYTASTTFVLEEAGSGGLGQYSGLASVMGINIGNSGDGLFQGDNIIELYKSRSMVEKTLLSETVYEGKKQLIIDRYIEFNKLRESWNENPELKGIRFDLKPGQQFTRIQNSILSSIVDDINKNYLSVGRPDVKLSIIKVDVKAEDEFFAKTFNDVIVKNVNDFYVQTKTRKSLENLSILQHQTDSVMAVFNGAIYQTAAATDATPNLNPTRQILKAPAQRSQFNIEANKAMLTQLIQNLEVAKLSLRKETPLIQVIDQPVYPLKRSKLRGTKGLFYGVFMFGSLSVIFLVLKKLLKDIMADE